MSRLRARCPDCRTLTAVALGPDYECHSCGREFGAGLLRVPRAWGDGGEAMVESASLPLSYPEVAVIEEDTLGEQTLALAAELPERPLVLGGCCCSHVGAIEGLAARHERLAEVGAIFSVLGARGAVVGAGLTGLAADPMSVAPLERLCLALGL